MVVVVVVVMVVVVVVVVVLAVLVHQLSYIISASETPVRAARGLHIHL